MIFIKFRFIMGLLEVTWERRRGLTGRISRDLQLRDSIPRPVILFYPAKCEDGETTFLKKIKSLYPFSASGWRQRRRRWGVCRVRRHPAIRWQYPSALARSRGHLDVRGGRSGTWTTPGESRCSTATGNLCCTGRACVLQWQWRLLYPARKKMLKKPVGAFHTESTWIVLKWNFRLQFYMLTFGFCRSTR